MLSSARLFRDWLQYLSDVYFPPRVKPLMLLLRGCPLGQVRSHRGMTEAFAGLLGWSLSLIRPVLG